MAPNITKDKLQQLLKQGLSQREIARRTGISRSTLRQRIKALGTHQGNLRVQQSSSARMREVPLGTPLPQAFMDAWEDLQEMQTWWRARKRAHQTEHTHHETQRHTYHVEKRYIEAIKRAADLEGVSLMEIVNRAFRQFFREGGRPE
jgi:transcriptional regulator with XRE-family HTH domain